MTPSRPDPGARLAQLWARLSPRPGGRWLFSRLLAFTVPYSGTIGARVEELGPGHARVTLRDRRRVRNHLNSIHAIALVNLGELTSGLAMLTGLRPGIRSIVTGLTVEFRKKARGRLTAEARVTVPEVTRDLEHEVTADITDEAGDQVARIRVQWRLGPTP